MRSPSARCVASYAAPLACAGGAYAAQLDARGLSRLEGEEPDR